MYNRSDSHGRYIVRVDFCDLSSNQSPEFHANRLLCTEDTVALHC